MVYMDILRYKIDLLDTDTKDEKRTKHIDSLVYLINQVPRVRKEQMGYPVLVTPKIFNFKVKL